MKPDPNLLVDASTFDEVYARWCRTILDAMAGVEPLAVVGIKRGGAALARRLRRDLQSSLADRAVGHGELDISLYRDDYHLQSSSPAVLGTEIEFTVDGASVLLVDDVLFTGRTVRAAMDLLLDFGRPRRIWLAVLVDRGHRELPIAADFTGTTIETEPRNRVVVELVELGDAENVVRVVSES